MTKKWSAKRFALITTLVCLLPVLPGLLLLPSLPEQSMPPNLSSSPRLSRACSSERTCSSVALPDAGNSMVPPSSGINSSTPEILGYASAWVAVTCSRSFPLLLTSHPTPACRITATAWHSSTAITSVSGRLRRIETFST